MYNEQSEDKRRRRLIILILLLLLLIVFGLITLYKTGTLSKVFNKEKYLGNPVIEKIGDKWEKKILAKISKDPKTDGTISYYEYCISETKDTNNCDWVRTTTKSVELTKTGKYYVSFRAVLEDGRISKPSTPELAKIDNANPKIEKVDKLEITENSIKVYVHAVDNESGVSKYLYSLDGINYKEGNKEYTFTGLNENTEYEIYVKVVDEVGNEIVVIETVKTSKKEEIKEDTPVVKPTKPSKTEDNKEEEKNDDKKEEEKEPENPEEPKEPELPEEPEWDMPTISLKDVPGFMVKGSSYKLPSDYDFGNDTGTVSCEVEEKKYTDTKDIDLGRYTIKCEAVSSHNKKATAEKEVLIEEEDIYDEPTIDLDDVPEVITIGDSYTLPSHYDFGNDTGTVKCLVKEVEYTNTSELEVGTHKIECTAISSHNKEAKAEKEIEVEPVWDTPLIDLEDVPDLITIGDEYILPSHYDFENDTGVVKCVVGEVEYTNTSELEIGTHKIECTATSSHNKEAKAEKEIEVEPVWDIPLINLDEVPLKFTYGDSYELPSFYDFGNDEGTVKCVVGEVEYTNTSEIKTGTHKIECTATSRHNKKAQVEKEVEIEYSVELEEEIDGWIKLNLYYPEGSTNWEWRLGEEEKIRTGYDNDGWMPYVEPILVRLDDIDDIYIRYDMEGVTYIIAPKGKITVDIEPDSWSLLEGKETNVRITYDKTATVKEYRINGGEWKTYEGKFKVGPDTLIEARAGRIDKVYNNLGEFQYDQTVTKKDRAYISKYVPEEYVPSSSTSIPIRTRSVSNNNYEIPSGYTSVTTPREPYNAPEVLEGPTIIGDPTTLTEEVVTITITTEYPARKIYYSESYGKYKEYTGPFEVSENKTIRAYYIRENDGLQSKTSYYYVENIKVPSMPYIKFKTTPGRYITDEIEKVEVEIIGTDCDSLEYSYDGVMYQEYTNKLEVRESKTIYARGRNENGETIESVTITSKVPPKEKEELSIMITTDPDKTEVTGLINKAIVTIDYDAKATKKYYRLDYYGNWVEYTGSFEVNENTTVYAYCTSENGRGEEELSINFLTTGISSPRITFNPDEPASEILVEIEYSKNAEEKKYKIGSGEWIDYTEPFYIYENTTVYAYNTDILGNRADSKKTVKNIIREPEYLMIDKGAYFIIRLNYPDVSDVNTREYKWKETGTWKLYDKKGILLIKADHREEIEAMATLDGIKVEDENGEEIIFEDHYYVLDVPLTEISENLFMRWSNEKPVAPTIEVNPSDEPAKEVDVIITYGSTLIKKYYKVVTADGDSGWKVYEGPFKVDRNCTIYAKGMNRIEIESKIGTKKIENIDEIPPTLDLKADLETPKQKVIVNVKATDDLEVDIVKYAKGRQNEEYFKENGNLVLNNGQAIITENGIYTFYAKDRVGNVTLEEIEVENVDLNAPDVTIINKTTGYGIEATIEIDYGDSSLKQYSIGNEDNYVNYIEEFTIKAEDVYNLANEDGSLTIYAKGKDIAGNITVVSEKIYNLDLDMPNEPVINSYLDYPEFRKNGFKIYDKISVTYDNRNDITNYIDINDGLGYRVYTGPISIKGGEIKVKSVKNTTGLTRELIQEVNFQGDALLGEAFDKDPESVSSIGANKKQVFKVNTQGEVILLDVKTNGTSGSKIRLYGSDGTTVASEVNITSATTRIKLLTSTKKVEIVAGSSGLNISEIELSGIVQTIKGESILSILQTKTNLTNGYYIFQVQDEVYPVHLYVLNGNQVITENTKYGDLGDVGTSNSFAENMVIVKVNGDYTVNENVTVEPYYTEYGGPKGFMLYVTGKLTNNGTINNSHGAYAEGQYVYLWKNSKTNDYEVVDKDGASGGEGLTSSGQYSNARGNNGKPGENRQTGGGGSGSSTCDSYRCSKSGNGTAGTSYSGGTGGTGAYGTPGGANGAQNGGPGGTKVDYGIAPGAGNPGGTGNENSRGANGTGGLLILYSNEFENKGTISAPGSSGGSVCYSAGGNTGGGSINIFTNQSTNINSLGTVVDTLYNSIKGTTNVNGGTNSGSCSRQSGGSGGLGTVNIGTIREGQYYDLKDIIRQDMETFENSVTISGDSILSILQTNNNLTTGYYTFKVTTSASIENYPIHLYVLNGNQTITENTKYGNEMDCATGETSDKMAKNMVIVKVNGDYTINENVTVEPFYTEYGGPKGFLLYVTGKLTNNGTISNSHGAYAEGQYVYLWKNSKTNDYEVVDKDGASGGEGLTSSGSYSNARGNNGKPGENRQTGGGGSGSSTCDSYRCSKSGDGTAGTSYSGGTGGTGAYDTRSGNNGTPNGGPGGTKVDYGIAPGAGNPGGTGYENSRGANGTGGLLILYSNEYENKGTISAPGSSGGSVCYSAGGNTGGGSINIFTNQSTNITSLGTVVDTLYNSIKGTTNVNGGTNSGNCSRQSGGSGGLGTVNIGTIREGQYYDLKDIIRQDMETFENSVTISGDSILSILQTNNNLTTGYYTFKVTTSASIENYPIHLYVLNGNQTITENTKYGNEMDCATGETSDKMAKNMVIVKVNGDYTVNENVTVEPYYTEYGGPKGFMLYVTGKLTNNGTINNSHGAYAEGQYVYLWKNSKTNDYEVVDKDGAAGGEGLTSSGQYSNARGNNGKPGENRQTGGGGSGSSTCDSYRCSKSGNGTAGTSYSGGTGGTGAYGTPGGANGTQNGGPGGTKVEYGIAPGAGNPGGTGYENSRGANGTGGLLIIYSNEYENKGTISAPGSSGGSVCYSAGGNTGGGSINIFTNQSTNITSLGTVVNTKYDEMKGTTNATGGANSGSCSRQSGGSGGLGTVNIGEIRDGQYYDLKTIIQQDIDTYNASH